MATPAGLQDELDFSTRIPMPIHLMASHELKRGLNKPIAIGSKITRDCQLWRATTTCLDRLS